MKRIGILGGTFNPPHLGHLVMANEALHAAGLDEVRFMPNFIAPHKEVSGASAEQRLEMTKLAIAGHPQFAVEDVEIKLGGVSFTYDTMMKMTEAEPAHEFYFIIGGDMIDGLGSWYRIDELVQLVRFIGIRRPGYENKTAYPVLLVDSPEIHLSSSMLRERISNGGTTTFLMPEQVETYIRKEQLYGFKHDAPGSGETNA
jgi:nicotinate-nucleotide adenylyltransferase